MHLRLGQAARYHAQNQTSRHAVNTLLGQTGITLIYHIGGVLVAKKRKHIKRKAWTNAHYAELRKHSKAKTHVSKISKLMKRTIGALRQQALKLGIPLGHRR